MLYFYFGLPLCSTHTHAQRAKTCELPTGIVMLY